MLHNHARVGSSLRKAKAKKDMYKETPGIWDKDTQKKTQDGFDFLNGKILETIAANINKDEHANLSQAIRVYNLEAQKLLSEKRIDRNVVLKRQTENCYPDFFKNKYQNNKSFTDSYVTLCSVFGINPLINDQDFLSELLNQELEFDGQEMKEIAYINISDVLKTKGNAINGPRREDIGVFNRKLFDSHSKELEPLYTERLVANTSYWEGFEHAIGKDRIISSDPVCVLLYDCQKRMLLGDFILVVHQNHRNERFVTLGNNEEFIFCKARTKNFKFALSTGKKKLNVFHLPSFSLFSIDFICDTATKFAYERLSEDFGPGSAP